MSSGGRWIREVKRTAIYLRDNFECLVCGELLGTSGPRAITLDHVVPRSRGGSHKARNLYTACLSCNSRRQDKALRVFASKAAVSRIRRARAKDLDPFLAVARLILRGAERIEVRPPLTQAMVRDFSL